MQVRMADHYGMCFGVRDAIALAVQQSESGPLSILGDLVHNQTVLADLQTRGIAIAQDTGQVKTSTVMVTAHGASARKILARRAGGRAHARCL